MKVHSYKLIKNYRLQSMTVRIIHFFFFMCNMVLTLHQNLAINHVTVEAELFYKQFFVRLENQHNPLIKSNTSPWKSPDFKENCVILSS